MSFLDDVGEKDLESLEKKIAREYERAYRECAQRAQEYFDTLEDRYQREFEAYKKGKYTEEEFRRWYQTQVERGAGYEKMKEDLAKRMAEANKVASSYINDRSPSVYSLNANYTAYEIDQITSEIGGSDWHVVNEQAVRNLMTNEKNVTEFRTVKTNPIRDYEWNSDQIQSAITSAILQGKDISQLSESFMQVMKRNKSSAIRNARTSYTSAQNAGRINTMKRAQDMGINVKKQWHSMEDGIVRFSHAMLNGQIRDVDKAFSNGLMEPADSKGAPEEVYNCRCKLEYILPDYEDVKSVENYDDTKKQGESYKEWLKRMQEKDQNAGSQTGSTLQIKTRSEAEKALVDIIGFDMVEPSLSKIDEQLLIESTQQLDKLEKKFGMIKRSSGTICSESSKSAVAYVRHTIAYPSRQNLSLCPSAFKDYDSHIASEKRAVKEKWSMPCKDIDLSVYTVTHEYGHIIQNVLLEKAYIANGWDSQDYTGKVDRSKSTTKARYKWYYNIADAEKTRAYKEIVQIAKSKNPEFVLEDHLSQYGKTNTAEFFAEVFANSQLGDPNELGIAMNEWLEKEGLIIK